MMERPMFTMIVAMQSRGQAGPLVLRSLPAVPDKRTFREVTEDAHLDSHHFPCVTRALKRRAHGATLTI